jgi:hypothetical protein
MEDMLAILVVRKKIRWPSVWPYSSSSCAWGVHFLICRWYNYIHGEWLKNSKHEVNSMLTFFSFLILIIAKQGIEFFVTCQNLTIFNPFISIRRKKERKDGLGWTLVVGTEYYIHKSNSFCFNQARDINTIPGNCWMWI